MFACQIFGLLVYEKKTIQLHILLFVLTFYSTFQHKAVCIMPFPWSMNAFWESQCCSQKPEILWLSGEEAWRKFPNLPNSIWMMRLNVIGASAGSLPLSRVHPVKTNWRGGGAAFLQPSPHKKSGSIFGHSSCVPHMHIPLECLVTSFSQRSMYTCVLGHLYLSCRHSQIKCVVPRDKVWLVEVGNMVRKPTDA